MYFHAPSLPQATPRPARVKVLPPPEEYVARLRGSGFAHDVEQMAESICRKRIPLFGTLLETGPGIRWRRDYVRGIETGLSYFRRIPYLDAARAGDHKFIWELNRHQHLVLLAQAWVLTERRDFLEEISRQLESWWEQNPFVRGMNWTSALEVAYRAISWIWIWHLAGKSLPEPCADRLLNELYRHGVFLENNLSVYFSPNTHLLGEAVALHAIGALFPDWPKAGKWRALGGQIVAEQMQKQVRSDGTHFEQSSAYHIYALDLFLFHALLEPPERGYRDSLRRMADYLRAISASDGTIPFLGDDDGGRFFHPYGSPRRFGAATLATCTVFFGMDDWPCAAADLHEQAAWWCGEKAFAPRPGHPAHAQPKLFPDAGIAVLSTMPAQVIVDTRGFGSANAGHSHADALHLVCRVGDRDILIDPGTYTYVGEPEWRTKFRGTAFHNTIRIDGLDQATQAGPFRWNDKPTGEVLKWSPNEGWCFLDAACQYRGFRHRRRYLWLAEPRLLAVADSIEIVTSDAVAQPHNIEQFWHCGDTVTIASSGNYRIGAVASLAVPPANEVAIGEGGEFGWQSEVPGHKVPKPVIVVRQRAALPAVLGAILFVNSTSATELTVESDSGGVRFLDGSGRSIEFPAGGDPIVHWRMPESRNS